MRPWARRAIEFYEQALEVAREGGDQRGEGNHLYNMSLAYHQLGEYTKAVSLAETAVKIYEMIEDPPVEKVRQKLAEWQTVLSE